VTYQEDFLHNKWAQIAVGVPQKYKLLPSDRHELAKYLHSIDDGKTDGHLTQLAVVWAKGKR
jgi:hypothetical protein